jgi:hypothetical protein
MITSYFAKALSQVVKLIKSQFEEWQGLSSVDPRTNLTTGQPLIHSIPQLDHPRTLSLWSQGQCVHATGAHGRCGLRGLRGVNGLTHRRTEMKVKSKIGIVNYEEQNNK